MRHPILLGVLVLFTCLLFSSIYSLHVKKKQMSILRDEAKNELAKIDKKTGDVTADMQVLDTVHGREKIIREKYNVKKPGERVIVVSDPSQKEDGVKATKTDIWYSITHFFNG